MRYFLPFLILFSALFSQNLSASYCLEIDKFKIENLASDVAYLEKKYAKVTLLSIFQDDAYLIVCSGDFQSRIVAESLLEFTKSSYPNAKVTTKGNSLKAQKKPKLSKELLNSESYYAIELQRIKASSYESEKAKLFSTVSKVPHSTLKRDKNSIILYTGEFRNFSDAKEIFDILHVRYKKAKIVELKRSKEQTKNTLLDENRPTIHYQEEKIIYQELNTKISNKLRSRKVIDETLTPTQHRLLENESEHFNGLYIKSNTAFDTLNSEIAYDIRLEFDMYDQGYQHAKKSAKKENFERQIEYINSLDSLETLSKNELYQHIEYYQNAINSFEAIRKLKHLQNALNRLNEKYQQRLITEYEYDIATLEIEKNRENIAYYHNLTLLKIPQETFELLNRIEHIQLKPLPYLTRYMQKNSNQTERYKLMMQKNEITHDWSDKLRLNFYVGARKMYTAQNQNLVGVDAKIPLTSYDEEQDKLIKLKNSVLVQEMQLNTQQEKESLAKKLSEFRYKQNILKRNRIEISKRVNYLDKMQKIDQLGYLDIYESHIDLDEASLQIYAIHLAAQELRLELYKLLVDIRFLSRMDEFEALIE